VLDGKPDAGAYEYGDSDANSNWTAGSTLKPLYSGIKDIQGKSGKLPTSFSLAQNYPNPFNGATTIHYTLTSPANVTLEIFSILGKKVATLISSRMSAGEKTVTWDGRNDIGAHVSSGVYIYRIQVNSAGKSYSESRKMVYVR
jgi:flagellar hook assembly protein FlgD